MIDIARGDLSPPRLTEYSKGIYTPVLLSKSKPEIFLYLDVQVFDDELPKLLSKNNF